MRVNVDDEALVDIRFDRLASLMGCSRHEVLGRMIRVWRHACNVESYTISAEDFDAAFDYPGGHQFAKAANLIALVEGSSDGVYYIRGSEGRFEWLSAVRENGKKGGRPITKKKPRNNQNGTKTEPSLLLAPSSLLLTQDTKSEPPSAAQELAIYLIGAIQEHYPNYRTTDSQVGYWAGDIEKAIRLDGRSIEELRAVIDYCHRNPAGSFWRKNVLSGSKLRQQFDRISIEMAGPVSAEKSRPYQPNPPQGSVPRADKPFVASAATDRRDPAEANVVAELARALAEKAKFLKEDA